MGSFYTVSSLTVSRRGQFILIFFYVYARSFANKSVRVHDMKEYKGSRSIAPLILTSTLDSREWQRHPRQIYPLERTTVH